MTQTVFRSFDLVKKDYTVLPNSFLQDRNICFATKGFLSRKIGLGHGEAPLTIHDNLEGGEEDRKELFSVFQQAYKAGYLLMEEGQEIDEITEHTEFRIHLDLLQTPFS